VFVSGAGSGGLWVPGAACACRVVREAAQKRVSSRDSAKEATACCQTHAWVSVRTKRPIRPLCLGLEGVVIAWGRRAPLHAARKLAD